MAAGDFRQRLFECLGGAWPGPCPLNAQVGEATECDGYSLFSVTYEAEPGDVVPAYLLIPKNATPESPAPAIACWHQHAGQYDLGKSEPAGLEGDPQHHTGAALAREGYVVLCPDAVCFEGRRDDRQQNRQYEEFSFLQYVVQGKCLAWKNILDMKRAIDFLVSRPEVKAGSIGSYGHSMGSTHGWLVGPWEDRLKCLVCNCCMPTYRGIHREHMLHCFPNFIPGIYEYGDIPDIVSLIAPRALHMNFGQLDRGSPIDEVRRGITIIEKAYREAGVPQNFSTYIEEGTGHVLSEVMWQRTRDWFARHLMGKT